MLETVTQTPGAIVIPPLKPKDILDHFKRIQALKVSLLDPKQDMVCIGNKYYITKSGWRKLAFAFNLTDEIVKEEKETKDDETVWRMWVKVTAPNNRSVIGIGACSTKERQFAHKEHDSYALAHTRSKNRAISDILGLGVPSAEEMIGIHPDHTNTETQSDTPRIETKNEPKVKQRHERITEYPIVYDKTTYGRIRKIDDEATILLEKPVIAESPPIGFLIHKILEKIKAKHPEFDFKLQTKPDGTLDTIFLRGLQDNHLKDLISAAGWAFSRAQSSGIRNPNPTDGR
jgi:hypothetical protein